jgi:hypothetical protein
MLLGPQRRTSAVKHGEKTGFDRCPLSSTAHNGALWTHAVFVWYFAVLDGFQPYNTKFGVYEIELRVMPMDLDLLICSRS